MSSRRSAAGKFFAGVFLACTPLSVMSSSGASAATKVQLTKNNDLQKSASVNVKNSKVVDRKGSSGMKNSEGNGALKNVSENKNEAMLKQMGEMQKKLEEMALQSAKDNPLAGSSLNAKDDNVTITDLGDGVTASELAEAFSIANSDGVSGFLLPFDVSKFPKEKVKPFLENALFGPMIASAKSKENSPLSDMLRFVTVRDSKSGKVVGQLNASYIVGTKGEVRVMGWATSEKYMKDALNLLLKTLGKNERVSKVSFLPKSACKEKFAKVVREIFANKPESYGEANVVKVKSHIKLLKLSDGSYMFSGGEVRTTNNGEPKEQSKSEVVPEEVVGKVKSSLERVIKSGMLPSHAKDVSGTKTSEYEVIIGYEIDDEEYELVR